MVAKAKQAQTEEKELEGFDEFWKSYPRKVGKGKAEQLWKKIDFSKHTRAQIQNALAAQRQSFAWNKEGGRFIPLPATWLGQKRWLDEPDNSGRPAQKPREAPTCYCCEKPFQDDGRGLFSPTCECMTAFRWCEEHSKCKKCCGCP